MAWWSDYAGGQIYSGWLNPWEPWNCPYGVHGANDLEILLIDNDSNIVHQRQGLGPVYDGRAYLYDCQTGILQEV